MEHNDPTDEPSESRLDAINRRFSLLMRHFLRLPEFWDKEDPQAAFKRHLDRINRLGLTLLMIGGVLAGLLLMVTAIRTDSSMLFFIGVGVIPGVYLAQFILSLVCTANLNLTFGAPIKLVSRLMPEVLTVFSIIGLIGYLIFGIISITQGFTASLQVGLAATGMTLLMLALLFFYSWLAANSGPLLGVRTPHRDTPQSPAEYFFSIILYFGRYQLALVPYQFLGTMLALFASAIYAGVLVLSGGALNMELLFLSALGIGSSMTALIWIVLLPVVAHFGYLLIVTVADLGIAFFRISGSAERIAELSEQAMQAALEEERKE